MTVVEFQPEKWNTGVDTGLFFPVHGEVLGLRVSGFEYRVEGQLQGSGFRVQGCHKGNKGHAKCFFCLVSV